MEQMFLFSEKLNFLWFQVYIFIVDGIKNVKSIAKH